MLEDKVAPKTSFKSIVMSRDKSIVMSRVYRDQPFFQQIFFFFIVEPEMLSKLTVKTIILSFYIADHTKPYGHIILRFMSNDSTGNNIYIPSFLIIKE
ncbi:MAG: hypothetical protein CL916_10115 [Deltaproteobacteria bacterium]|nr:hypothetical protein [Deltaproteobacteria bacterium]